MCWTIRREQGALSGWVAPAVIVCGILIAWFGYAAYLFSQNPAVLLSDVFGFIVRAQQLSLVDASVRVHGFYPFGYPLLLRAAFAVTGDYEAAGRLISVIAGGYYDVSSPVKAVYATTWFESESLGRYTTVETIVAEMRKHGQRYLVTDQSSPKLLGWPDNAWNVSSPELRKHFDVLSQENAGTTVMKLRDE